MLLIALLPTLLLAAVLVHVVLVVLPARLAAQSEAERQEVAAAALAAVRAESEATLHQAMGTMLDVAGDKLGDHVRAGNQALDLRGEKLTDQVEGINAQMAERVGHMNGELRQLRELVASLQKERAEQHGQIVTRLEDSVRTSTELAGVTGALREALASPKTRGSWGERMAEDVLRLAGFVDGVNYRKQKATANGRIPDFTFLLPEDRLLHMDVKFPADNYVRHLEADTDIVAAEAAAAFLRDVRTQVKGLAARDYVEADTTVDYLLMFIPNESIYAFLHEQDPSMIDDALAQKVVLCSPVTLFPMLSIIRQAMDNFMVARTSGEIMACLAGFDEQWGKFCGQMDKVDKALARTNTAFEELSGPRRRVLQRKIDEIDEVRTSTGLDPADPGEAVETGAGEAGPGVPHLREVG